MKINLDKLKDDVLANIQISGPRYLETIHGLVVLHPARLVSDTIDYLAKIGRLMPDMKYPLGTLVQKTKGSSWRGKVVGFYSTELTPIGYAVESIYEPGSVQIYPESALEPLQAATEMEGKE